MVCQRPTGNLPGILAYPYFSVIDVSVVEQGIVSTGPYKLDSMQAGVGAELSRNEYYWNGEVPYDTVSILFHRGQLYQSHGPPERGCRFGGKHHHRQ